MPDLNQSLKLIVPRTALAVGVYAGVNTPAAVLVFVVSFLPWRSMVSKPLPQLSPSPYVAPPKRVAVPEAFEANIALWRQVERLITCSRVCRMCTHYHPNEDVQCAVTSGIHSLAPSGDPYVDGLKLVVISNNEVVASNNLLLPYVRALWVQTSPITKVTIGILIALLALMIPLFGSWLWERLAPVFLAGAIQT